MATRSKLIFREMRALVLQCLFPLIVNTQEEWMRFWKFFAAAGVTLFLISAAAPMLRAEKSQPLEILVYVTSAPLPVSPEGFVEGSDKVLIDSVGDLKKALDGKEFHPNKGYPGSKARYRVVQAPDKADIVLTVAARGINLAALGQRTTMSIYSGVVVADTIPTVGVTPWVSAILSVGTYKKEILTYSTNRSRFSAGAWRADTNLIALMAAGWVMVNQD